MEALIQRTRRREAVASPAERTTLFPSLRGSVFPEDLRTSVFPDLRPSARDTAPIEVAEIKRADSCKQGETNNSGKMFPQITIGQRISTPGGEEVVKFTVISFTIPDLIDKNFEVVNAIKRESALFSSIVGKAISFDEKKDASHGEKKDAIVGCFGMAEQPLSDKQLHDLVNAVYNAVERIVTKYKNAIEKVTPGAFEEFMAEHSVRKEKIEAVIIDAKVIFLVPEHTGARAYHNTQRFGKRVFRMEWVYKDGEVMTLGPPETGYERWKVTESIAADECDKAFTRALLDFINVSYAQGAKTIIALQVNNTATIGRCAENDGYNKKWEQEEQRQERLNEQLHMQNANLTDNLYSNLSQAAYMSITYTGNPNPQQTQTGNPNPQGNSTQGGSGSTSGSASQSCTNCGKSIEAGQCSCGNILHHRRPQRQQERAAV